MNVVHRDRRKERGVALLMALFALIILSAIGLGMMYSANTETSVNNNYRGTSRAYYAALAGLEEARDRLNTTQTTNPISPPTSTPVSAGGTIYIVNPYLDSSGTVVNPQPWSAANTYFDDEYCREFAATNLGVGVRCTAAAFTGTNWYGYYTGGATTYAGTTWHANAGVPSLSPNTSTANALDYRWVRIQLKTNFSTNPICVNGSSITCSTTASQGAAVCWNGSTEVVAPGNATSCTGNLKPVYLLTSLAIAPNGSREMVQTELVQNIINLPTPAAVTLAGPLANPPATVCGNGIACGGAFVADGASPSSCGGGTTSLAFGTTDDTSRTNLCDGIDPTKYANYPGGSGTCGGSNTSSIANVNSSALTTVAGLENLVSSLSAIADYKASDCSAFPDASKFGQPGSPKIAVISGDCNMSSNPSPAGEGILVVTGQYNFTDNPYNGIVYVVGQGIFNQQSAKNSHFDGAVLVAKTRDSSGNLLSTPGAPTLNWHSGTGKLPPSGTPSFEYDSCRIASVTFRPTFRALATHDLNY